MHIAHAHHTHAPSLALLSAFVLHMTTGPCSALGLLECRDKVLPILSVLPVVGPAIYLLLRPKTDLSK